MRRFIEMLHPASWGQFWLRRTSSTLIDVPSPTGSEVIPFSRTIVQKRSVSKALTTTTDPLRGSISVTGMVPPT